MRFLIEPRSPLKAIRELGYPGRWTLHRWIRERDHGSVLPHRPSTLKRYSLEVKLEAVALFNAGESPQAVADRLGLTTKMNVYSWAQRFRENGEWGLMSNKERKQAAGFRTQASFEALLPDDVQELKKDDGSSNGGKAVLEKEP